MFLLWACPKPIWLTIIASCSKKGITLSSSTSFLSMNQLSMGIPFSNYNTEIAIYISHLQYNYDQDSLRLLVHLITVFRNNLCKLVTPSSFVIYHMKENNNVLSMYETVITLYFNIVVFCKIVFPVWTFIESGMEICIFTCSVIHVNVLYNNMISNKLWQQTSSYQDCDITW